MWYPINRLCNLRGNTYTWNVNKFAFPFIVDHLHLKHFGEFCNPLHIGWIDLTMHWELLLHGHILGHGPKCYQYQSRGSPHSTDYNKKAWGSTLLSGRAKIGIIRLCHPIIIPLSFVSNTIQPANVQSITLGFICPGQVCFPIIGWQINIHIICQWLCWFDSALATISPCQPCLLTRLTFVRPLYLSPSKGTIQKALLSNVSPFHVNKPVKANRFSSPCGLGMSLWA